MGKLAKPQHSSHDKIRIIELDFIRAFSILLIVFYHSYAHVKLVVLQNKSIFDMLDGYKYIHGLGSLMGYVGIQIANVGQLSFIVQSLLIFTLNILYKAGLVAVPVFFLLSGFSLAIGYPDAKPEFSFWITRIKKLLFQFIPAFFVVLIGDILVQQFVTVSNFPVLFAGGNFPFHLVNGISLQNILAGLFLNFTLDFPLHFAGMFDGAWWFLSTIVQLYLIYPYILKLIKRYNLSIVLTLSLLVNLVYSIFCVLVLHAHPTGSVSDTDILSTLFPMYIFVFTLGICLAQYYKGINGKSVFTFTMRRFLVISAAFLLYLQLKDKNQLIMSFFYIIEAPLMFFFLYYLSSVLSVSNIANKVFKNISDNSYMIYLTHQPLIVLWIVLFVPLLYKVTNNQLLIVTVEVILILLISYLVALFTNKLNLYERIYKIFYILLIKVDNLLLRVKDKGWKEVTINAFSTLSPYIYNTENLKVKYKSTI